MTQPRPTAAELLESVRDLLSDGILPTLDGHLRFHTRVAVNVLDLVVRELVEGPKADEAERSRLVAIMGAGASTADVDELAALLAAGIRAGTIDIGAPDLVDHLRRTARVGSSIVNPRHTQPERSGDV